MARTDDQSGRHSSSALLVSTPPATLNGQVNVDLVYSHNGNFYRRFRERKGTTSSMSVNAHTQPFTSPDPCRTSNRSKPRVYPHSYHIISSPFPSPSSSFTTRHSRRIPQQDSFYKRHTPEELELAFQSLYDFDHPDSVDMPLFAAVRSAPVMEQPRSC